MSRLPQTKAALLDSICKAKPDNNNLHVLSREENVTIKHTIDVTVLHRFVYSIVYKIKRSDIC